ncbi:MAG: helix-turn-helix domain-containing protein [Clostridia bacterium]|nr:helix-turn-helix domain-containing protein [Clostridia bacterium]
MLDNNLKKIRRKCALTQQQVADALGLERSTYTYYELGKTSPTIQTLHKIIALYECDFEDIYPSANEDISKSMSSFTNLQIAESKAEYQPSSSINVSISQLHDDEKELIINYRLLKPEDKQKIFEQTLEMIN